MIDALQGATASQRLMEPTEQVAKARKTKDELEKIGGEQQQSNEVQPEELLNQIKALTEDGLFSVRFENDDSRGSMIVKIVDQESGEVVREIPPEDLRQLSAQLSELRGNLVDTVG